MNNNALPRIVLVEDNPDDELMSLRAIQRVGIACQISVRRDGAEALGHLLDDQEPAPELVLLDYMLPKKNGLEILSQLRTNVKTCLVPVVIFSDIDDWSELAECYRKGANSCVSKPIDPWEYYERLAYITRYWLTVNKPSEDRYQSPLTVNAGTLCKIYTQ